MERKPQIFGVKKADSLPEAYWINHIAVTFVETVKWWVENGMQEDSQTLCGYTPTHPLPSSIRPHNNTHDANKDRGGGPISFSADLS